MENLNTIPKDLFPIKENEYSRSWAIKTFLYSHIFLANGEPKLNPSEQDINLWRNKAIQLRAELASIGKLAGTNKMLEIANFQYNLKLKGTNLKCTSIQDILTVVGDKEWYNEDKKTRIDQIYMLIYGLTRQGFNQWLIDLEQDWMKKNNITYITKLGRHDLAFNSRGSIYSLLKKVFNNNVIKQFKQKMWFHHREYICVRMKITAKEEENVDVQQVECRWGKVYLCSEKKKPNQELDMKCINEDNFNSGNIHQCGRIWVFRCLQKGLNKQVLHRYVNRWAESYAKTIETNDYESKLIISLMN